jgi:hypothetical protein
LRLGALKQGLKQRKLNFNLANNYDHLLSIKLSFCGIFRES